MRLKLKIRLLFISIGVFMAPILVMPDISLLAEKA